MCAPADECCREYAARADWPADVSRRLFEALASIGLEDRSVLEVGCGYGRMLVGALLGGARSAMGVELDDEAVSEAVARADREGVASRCSVILGDGALLSLPRHDVVILDRVICCYADAERLVDRTVAAAALAYAFSLPESRGLRGVRNRVVYGLEAVWDTLRGNGRTYLHDVRRVEARLSEAGFRRLSSGRAGKWYLAVYRRPEPGQRRSA